MSKQKQGAKNKSGFSLLEVMAATIVLGIIAIASSSYFVHAARERMSARARQAALIEANTLMEQAFGAVHTGTYDSSPGYLSSNMTYSSGNPGLIREFDGKNIPKTIKVEPSPSGIDNLLKITVTVFFSDTQSVTLEAEKYCN